MPRAIRLQHDALFEQMAGELSLAPNILVLNFCPRRAHHRGQSKQGGFYRLFKYEVNSLPCVCEWPILPFHSSSADTLPQQRRNLPHWTSSWLLCTQNYADKTTTEWTTLSKLNVIGSERNGRHGYFCCRAEPRKSQRTSTVVSSSTETNLEDDEGRILRYL